MPATSLSLFFFLLKRKGKNLVKKSCKTSQEGLRPRAPWVTAGGRSSPHGWVWAASFAHRGSGMRPLASPSSALAPSASAQRKGDTPLHAECSAPGAWRAQGMGSAGIRTPANGPPLWGWDPGCSVDSSVRSLCGLSPTHNKETMSVASPDKKGRDSWFPRYQLNPDN